LDIANEKNFAMSIDLEANQYGSRDALIHALTYVRDQLMPHGAFARVNGKPVLFFWRQQVRSVDDWAEIRRQVDPNHDQIWIAEGVNIAYQHVFDGHHLYSIAWSANVAATLNDWAKRVRRAGADRLWVATVMPGYDDTRTTRAGKFARDRRGGEFYRDTWRAALGSQPDLIVIDSFNEWVEGSSIEPSASYGNLYLDITREFSAQFRAVPLLSAAEKSLLAASPTPRPTRAFTPTRDALPTPTQVLPTPTIEFPDAYRTTELLRVRAGPGTTFDIRGTLPRGTVLDVLARSEDNQWLAIAYPDYGALGWISAAFVAPPRGFDQFPVEPAPALVSPTPTRPPEPDSVPIWY
jgi:Glycosyl hydrolase family 99/Bacterial SH3 domain